MFLARSTATACLVAAFSAVSAAESPAPSSYEATLQTLRAEVTQAVPKIDGVKLEAFSKARAEEAAAAETVSQAQAAATSKKVQNKEAAAQAYQNAQQELAKAQEKSAKAAAELLSVVNPFLASDKLDATLVKAVILTDATPAGLAEFAAQGAEQAARIEALLGDTALMKQMLVAGGAKFAKYGEAMRIYTAILKASPRAKEGMFQRLALGTALEHADPIPQSNPADQKDGPATVDPVKRYQHYEKAFLDGELDPAFKDLTVWDYRMVVNCDAPDETLSWGRTMLRNYRPDHITNPNPGWRYSILVKTDVLYGSKDNDKDRPSLQNYQNIIANGGVCGRRAFFARFLLRSFGIPVWGVTQKAHAAVGRWTPNGWLVNLGAAFKWSWWDKDEAPRSGSDFLLETQARRLPDEYLKVLRAQWVSRIFGEEQYNDRKNIAGGLWSGIAHAETEAIAARSNAQELGPVGQDVAESNESKEAVAIQAAPLTDTDKKVTVDGAGRITLPAVACDKTSGAIVAMASHGGGGQLHVNRELKQDQTFSYTFESPKAGAYQLSAKVVTVQADQKLRVSANGAGDAIEIPLPYTIGLWENTTPVAVTLTQGRNVLAFTRPADPGRGVTIKEFTLTPAK